MIRFLGVTLASFVALAGFSASSAVAGCASDLSHLDRQLPNYPDSELHYLRETVLLTNVQQTINEQARIGATAEQAGRNELTYLIGLEDNRGEAESCVRKTALQPEAVLAALNNGTYAFGSARPPVSDACAASYVRYRYAVAQVAELSKAMLCTAENW